MLHTSEPLLEVRDLKTYFTTEAGTARAVDGVDFSVRRGEILGIVGESGSGKSVTALSILRLIPQPPGFFAGGEIFYDGTDLLSLSYEEMRNYRGREISMIFQEPMTSLNPVFTIRTQLTEAVLRHNPESGKEEAIERAADMLDKVGIPDPIKRLKEYPHQYSGGMRQRVMIAMALLNNPGLLIADEPTTALDVTIQDQILELILKQKEEREGSSAIFITHDLAVIAETCDRVMVMYGGRVQEMTDVYTLFDIPLHPYTLGLMNSIPRPGGEKEKLETIKGMVPSIFEIPDGCRFCARCPDAFEPCFKKEPELFEVSPGHQVRCHKYSKNGGLSDE